MKLASGSQIEKGAPYWLNQYSSDYWIPIRDILILKRELNGESPDTMRCGQWGLEAKSIVEKVDGFDPNSLELVSVIFDPSSPLRTPITKGHVFLRTNKDDGTTYIADGTSYQFGVGPREGYYGPLDEAPPLLRQIYSLPSFITRRGNSTRMNISALN